MSDLAEVFQYDGDVHVDDDKERDDEVGDQVEYRDQVEYSHVNDEVGDQVEYRHAGVAAVAVRFHGRPRIVAVGRIDHQTGQHAVPPG